MSGTMANITDAFLDRLSKGKGRIIITASSASEVSKEREVPKATDQKQHPVKKGEAEGQVVIGRVR